MICEMKVILHFALYLIHQFMFGFQHFALYLIGDFVRINSFGTGTAIHKTLEQHINIVFMFTDSTNYFCRMFKLTDILDSFFESVFVSLKNCLVESVYNFRHRKNSPRALKHCCSVSMSQIVWCASNMFVV